MLTSADEAEQSASEQIWHSLLWISPLNDEPAERDMLHLDDELAGLIEAADMPADSHGTHSTKPEPASQGPGEGSVVLSQPTNAMLAMRCCMPCRAVPCYAVLCCAVLCGAMASSLLLLFALHLLSRLCNPFSPLALLSIMSLLT